MQSSCNIFTNPFAIISLFLAVEMKQYSCLYLTLHSFLVHQSQLESLQNQVRFLHLQYQSHILNTLQGCNNFFLICFSNLQLVFHVLFCFRSNSFSNSAVPLAGSPIVVVLKFVLILILFLFQDTEFSTLFEIVIVLIMIQVLFLSFFTQIKASFSGHLLF